MPKGKFTPFTPDQEQFIKENYLKLPAKTLGHKVNATGSRITRYLKAHNLHVPREVIERNIANSRFKKGQVPANKGKKQSEYISPEAIEKTKATRFKKGHLPHNTLYNGAIVSRPDSTGRIYKYIRLDLGVWDLFHRVIWEQHKGSIPEGSIVCFKDGNSDNVKIENLELVSREENMLRNSRYQIPEELIPTKALIAQLEKKLNQLQNGQK